MVFPVTGPPPTAVMAPLVDEVNPDAFAPDAVVDLLPVAAGLYHDGRGLSIDDGRGLSVDNGCGSGLCIDNRRRLRDHHGSWLSIDHGSRGDHYRRGRHIDATSV